MLTFYAWIHYYYYYYLTHAIYIHSTFLALNPVVTCLFRSFDKLLTWIVNSFAFIIVHNMVIFSQILLIWPISNDFQGWYKVILIKQVKRSWTERAETWNKPPPPTCVLHSMTHMSHSLVTRTSTWARSLCTDASFNLEIAWNSKSFSSFHSIPLTWYPLTS